VENAIRKNALKFGEKIVHRVDNPRGSLLPQLLYPSVLSYPVGSGSTTSSHQQASVVKAFLLVRDFCGLAVLR
jgi:hypothetical protein